MKFTITMKDPDGAYESIEEFINAMKIDGIEDDDEAEAIRELRGNKIRELCLRWFEYGEYLRVEVDTDAETCTVLPAKRS